LLARLPHPTIYDDSYQARKNGCLFFSTILRETVVCQDRLGTNT
jgi:hypothetical protein